MTAMKKLYMIGNAHLDPVWLWRWQEGFQENKATFFAMLRMLDQYDDVVFTSSSAQLYQWIERNHPAMFAQIKQRIQQGRWILCGGWWVQPDCNIPCGESFARHTLLAQNYFLDKFGVAARTGYNVDSFGHHGMLPQLLRLSGMDSYVFMRPGPHEKSLPAHHFLWESDDGSQVTAFRIPFSYCVFDDLEGHIQNCAKEFDPNVDMLMCFYGVGNHGGGPTRENLKTIQTLRPQMTKEGVDLVLGDPNSYFTDLLSKGKPLPVVHDDLQHHASGCYSVQSAIKRMNRRAEHALLRTERLASLAGMLGKSPWPDCLDHAWQQVLFNQFHDTLAGTAIQSAYQDAENQLGEAISIADREETYATQTVSFAVDIPKEDNTLPVVVFNPHAWEVNAPIAVESGLFCNQPKGDISQVYDCAGNLLPSQFITPNVTVTNRRRILFPACVPALGYATYHIKLKTGQASAAIVQDCSFLENDRVQVRFCNKTGTILSLYHKALDTELAAGPMAQAVVIKDESDTWSHGVTRFDEEIGIFQAVSVKMIEQGPVCSSMQVVSRYQASILTQTFTLYTDSADLHVKSKLNWQEKFKCLKLRFPVAVTQGAFTLEIPFGVIVKEASGEEEAMQRWMDMTGMTIDGVRAGLTVINDSKHSASANGSVMDMMILRSPVYAHHDPTQLQADTDTYEFVDQGIQTFEYMLAPHTGDWREAAAVRKAWQLNMPMLPVIETFHEGELPQSFQSIEVTAPNVVVSAVKKALYGEDFIVRLHECEGQRTDAQVCLPLLERQLTIHLAPWQIKTLRISREKEKPPQEVDLLERKLNKESEKKEMLR